MAPTIAVQPSFDQLQTIITDTNEWPNAPNLIPLCTSLSSEFLTPSAIYLKIAASSKSKLSFLFESAATSETIGRYSFIGADPRKTLVSGPKHGLEADPLPQLDKELSQYRIANIPSLRLPPLTAGAIGYVGYDCVKYFEPKTKRPMKDILEIPESLFMLYDTIVAVDHFFQKIIVITYLHVPTAGNAQGQLAQTYEASKKKLADLVHVLKSKDLPLPPQGPIELDQKFNSNIGREGYEAHVTRLKKHIVKGDIIQAVPSQRVARPTSLHPFNIYRHLRTVNPSPYLFYLDCEDFQIIGASPEVLVKEEAGRIITHPIAGTIKRGTTPEEDLELAETLHASLKDRAEHVMLVDLARNDVNRVCDPLSTRVDKLMIVQKFSHVQHLTSEVSGVLRREEGKTRFDAFRSIFPAGTVSGAPKIKAMELIAELEGEKRGVYAGAVGYFGFNMVNPADGEEAEGAMDTCIALRTMMTKDGVAYLQAGGGIVFDSDEGEEYEETMNKMMANMRCIEQAEKLHWEEQQGGLETTLTNGAANGVATEPAKVDLAAG